MEQRNKRGFQRKALLAGVLGAGSFTLAGCDVAPPENGFFEALRMGVPYGVTPEATAIGNFWVWVWVAAWIIGIIMWGLMIYAIFGFSAKKAAKAGKGEFPKQLQYNVPLELVLTIIPIFIVMALFFFTVQTQDKVTALDKDPKVKVDVTGFQWNWKFGYGEVAADLSPTGSLYKGVDKQRQDAAEASKVDAEYQADPHHGGLGGPIHGKSKSDMSYLRFDKIETVGTTDEIPVLVLPSQTPIEFDLASSDVGHAFWVPEFLFKRDVYPQPEANNSQRRFQIEKIEKEGAFVGRCAEMCGTYHAMMNFEVRVVTPAKFKEYLKYRNDNPQATNAEALRSIGEEPYATSTKPFVSDRLGTRDGANVVTNG
ncbi:cytochrome c oxidase subunit II [Staphylococcus chromogenes]|nr:cytochrome c oxidase subunit II [Staphylococcus chromogenes]